MELLQTLKSLPINAGVYQYFDKFGKLLYIGKAKNLKNRVKSYFRFTPSLHASPLLSPRISKMINEVEELRYIIVDTEHDALILENSLIKQLKPKYNILLRDDKTYPYIYINFDEDFPIPEITRKVIKKQNVKYYGPFSSGGREILTSIFDIVPLVQSKSCLRSKKACMFHQIKKCLAPCEGKITSKEYKEIYLNQAIEFIEDRKKLTNALSQKMLEYAENLRFEEAGKLRDVIKIIDNSSLYSNVDLAKLENLDIFYIQNENRKAILINIFVRNGKVISSSNRVINLQKELENSEIYKRILLDFYSSPIPITSSKILVAEDFEDRKLVTEVLSEKFSKKISIITPTTNERKNLIKLAQINAIEVLKNQNSNNILLEIKAMFKLDSIPYKIETFDTSHHHKQSPVASKIVYENFKFKKDEYRHYNLTSTDEYSQMRETLIRRVESFDKISPPDLWLIDGGKAQLNLAKEILESAGIDIDILAISKEKIDAKAHRAKGKANDIIYSLNDKFKLPPSDKKLQFLQKLRDESHRFAIEYHRKQKIKEDKEIDLLNIKGIGKAKVVKLINYFGTFENIKNASFEELSKVLNQNDAKNIKALYEN